MASNAANNIHHEIPPNDHVDQFMNSPLVTWVKTFREDDSLDYKQLTDGVFLYDVMLQIESFPPNRGIHRSVDDVTSRTRNFDILVKNVTHFYQENLGQLILLKLPDVVAIGSEPESETSVEAVQMLLLLILGCAVQCDKKERFVENIKQLDYNMQHSIVTYIQRITDNPESVWTDDWDDVDNLPNDQVFNIYKSLALHIKRIIHERDSLSQRLTQLVLYQDGSGHNMSTNSVNSSKVEGSPSNDKHHMGVELADSKAKLRRIRQDLEEKTEVLTEIKDELDQTKCTVNKLRQENLDLVQEARAAKAYRDEIDVLKERAAKVDKLENEIQRYKDKMNEMDFYKSRVDELREENRILVETKEMLEDQLEASRKRAEQVFELETDILKYKARLNELLLEKDADKEKITDLIEDNTQLKLDKKSSMNESAILHAELKNIKAHNNSMMESSLSEQINDNAHGKVLKLELEIQRLQSALDNNRESSFHASSEKILELEKENKRLSLKVDQLQESNQKQMHTLLDLEQEHDKCSHETAKLQNIIETLRTSSQRHQNELQLEKQQLTEIIDTLRERNKKSEHARFQDIESENKKLIEQFQNSKSEICKLEFDKQQLKKSVDKLKDSNNGLLEIQIQKEEIEKENSELLQTLAMVQSKCDKHEKLQAENNDVKIENSRIKKSLESLKTKNAKMEKTEHENLYLKGENQKLNKALDTLKNSANKLLDIEHEKEELVNQNKLLIKNMEVLKLNCSKLELIEVDMMSVTNENQRLHKTIETCNKKLDELGHENQDLESENSKLQKTVETLKLSTRRYNDLERDVTEMEADNDRLTRENRCLEKESARLKQSIQVKDSNIDEISSKISTMERENKRLQKEVEISTDSTQRLKDLEKENKEVIQQLTVDKKTLVIIREDLVNEKIRTQQLQNELEKLNSELQKIGINKEKLINAEHEADQNRYKMLENLLEDTLKNSLEIKDEKISGLQSRLRESQERCSELKEQLNKVTSQCDSYKHKYEHICKENTPKDDDINKSSLQNEVLNLKEVITELERTNGGLKEDSKSLHEHASSWKDQASGLQSQLMNLQRHCSSITEQNTELQLKHAKIQVENTTLASQIQSLNSHNSLLQNQISSVETERNSLKGGKGELQAVHNSLVGDHEALQKLHEQLNTDFENLVGDFTNLKVASKAFKAENKALKEKLQNFLLTEEEVLKIKQSLEDEKSNFRADCKSLINLRTEHHRLKDDFRALHVNCEKIKCEYKDLQTEYKKLKTENNSVKLKNTELQGDLADSKAQANSFDIQVSKLTSKCEILMQMNSTLEDDRKSLMAQLSALLTQYHDLLTQTLTDKESFHEEEKLFADKLNNLRRQKETLEQKIMDQYRQMENSPKRRGFGANFVKRVRKAGTELISRVPKSGRSRERLDQTDSTDNSSSSATDVTNRNSPDSVEMEMSCDLSHPMSKSKELTSLYSVRNMRKSLPPSSSIFEQHQNSHRGSFSSEDIRSILTDSQSSDGHHGDQESPTPSIKSSSKTDSAAKPVENLILPGSRKAVYYTSIDGLNHDDTIPTRDVGPGIASKASDKSTLPTNSSSPHHINVESSIKNEAILGNGRNTPEGLAKSMSHCELKTNNPYVSMINLPLSSPAAPLKSSTPVPLPRKNSTTTTTAHRKSLSHINAERKDSNSSSNSSDMSPHMAPAKSWRTIDTNNSKPSSPEHTNSNSNNSTPHNARRNSKQLNGIGSETKTKNSAFSPQHKIKPEPNESSKCDPCCDSKEKRTDNSIWYEYGCV